METFKEKHISQKINFVKKLILTPLGGMNQVFLRSSFLIQFDYSISSLGDSLTKVIQKFLSLEKRFTKDAKLKLE